MFEKDAINTGRQIEVDMAKAILVFIFAFVHMTICCNTEEALTHGLPYVFDSIIGGPFGAPTLMFCMGVGMVYARKNDPLSLFRRGVRIFILGYIFNICQCIAHYITMNIVVGNYHDMEELLYSAFDIDIMQFAGLAFMLMALFKKLNLSKWIMLLISFLMSVVATLINGIDVGIPALNIIVGHFFGVEDVSGNVLSDFPLFNWFILVVSGFVFAGYLIRVKNKNKFYLTVSPICILIAGIYIVFGVRNGFGMLGEGENCFYHATTLDVFITINAAMAMFGIYHVIAKVFSAKVSSLVTLISKNINSEYCIHWIFVIIASDILMNTIGLTNEISMTVILAVSTLLSVLSITLAWLWKDKKVFRISRNK